MLQDDENPRACRIHIIQQRMRDINRHVRIEGSTCLHHNTSRPFEDKTEEYETFYLNSE